MKKFTKQAVCMAIATLFMASTQVNAQDFQKVYGTALDNSFTKVIQDGTNYFVLGQDEAVNGSPQHATVTRLDANGNHLWTLAVPNASIWNDGVLISAGELMVVGSTLPFDAETKSLIGRVTATGGGNFAWLRTYDVPDRESFTRVVKNPAPGMNSPFYVLGFQNQSGSNSTTEDVVLLNLNANGTFLWKKKYASQGDDEFFSDLEALPSGDLLIAGRSGGGGPGLIYKVDNAGVQFGGVQIAAYTFNDVSRGQTGDIYATANASGQAHVLKFDQDMLLMWDIIIPEFTSVRQVFEGFFGEIYVVGRGIFGGIDRHVVLHLTDVGTPPNSVDWVRYLNSGNAINNGFAWWLQSGQIAFNDTRIIPGGFGQNCAFLSVSDKDMATCNVSDAAASLIFADPIPDGPIGPGLDFQDVFPPATLQASALNWQEQEVCSNNPCVADFTVTFNCFIAAFNSTSNVPGTPSYSWSIPGATPSISNFQNPTVNFTTCGDYQVCLTVTASSPATCTATVCHTVSVVDITPPIVLCKPMVVVSLGQNCSATIMPADVDDGSSDNCLGGGATLSQSNFTQCGTFPVTLTVQDWCGNIGTCTTQVQVVDNTLPTIVCPPSITKDCNTNTSPNDTGFATASDNCSTPTVTFTDVVSGLMPCNASIVRTWKATDACGNMFTCGQTITVIDNAPPIIVCPPAKTIACNTNTGPNNCGTATATDNCDPTTVITYSDVTFGQLPCNGGIQRTWKAEDDCGNVSLCIQNITISDNVLPTLSNCPSNQVVNGIVGPNGQCTANVQVASPIATDNCDPTPSLINSFNNTANASGTYPNGTTTVTWAATDACGNLKTCSFDVIVSCGAPVCCPKFSLTQLDSITPCPGDNNCNMDSVANLIPIGHGPRKFIACKNSVHSYYVIPNLPGFIYNWTVTGGTPTSFTGNPGVITWGSGSQGFIEVIVTDLSGNCRDTINAEVCLLDAPVAAFTIAPSTTVCTNQPVSFTNTSVGANTYNWDFGDGTSSSSPNPPPHSYPSVGIYTVLLTVSNGASGNVDTPPCGCIDTATVIITVLAGTGPTIRPICEKMLCPGDTATYCVSPGCAPYNWTVNGGTITTNNGACITVQWDATAPTTFPAFVSVTTGCGGICGNSATLNVPVLWPNMPVSGPKIVCVGTTSTYSLPVMPGTFYTWSISGIGGTIVGPTQNTPSINVQWNNFASTGNIITCIYNNPYSGCSDSTKCTVDVKNKFALYGPSPLCPGALTIYGVTSGLPANWTISPATGYTVGTSTNVSTIAVTWTTPGNYTISATPANPALFCNPSSTIYVTVNPAPVVNIVGPLIVCPNQLYNYTANSNLSGGSFTWTLSSGTASQYGPNNSNASVNFTGTGPWTLMVSQTIKGCTGTASISIQKEPAPTLPSGSITTCIGGNVSVAVATGNGPFTWSSTPAASLTGGQGTSSATYEIHGGGSIMVSNCSGSATMGVNITTPTAISITPTGTLCPGPIQLTTTSNGQSYQWFGGSSSNNQLNVTLPGTYTVQVTFPDGCKSVATHTVAPVAIPTVTISTGDPLQWCPPAIPSVILQAFTLSNGCTYQWYNSSGLIAGAVGPTYTATAVGSYHVVVTCNGCSDTSNTLTVYNGCPTPNPGSCNGIPNPLSAITVSNCNPKSFSVNVTGCPGGVVNWNFGDGQTATGTSVSNTYTQPGAYLVIASIDCNNCHYEVHTNVNIPVIADFNSSVVCGLNGNNTITLNNTSQTLGGWNVTSVNWSSSCGSPSFGSGNTYTLNTIAGCSPIVTMSITVVNPLTGQTCTDTKAFPFNFATIPLTINGITMVCENETYTFNSSLTGTNIVLYQWTVNSIPVSQISQLMYAFDGTTLNPIVGLTVTDVLGCTYTASVTLTVVTPRPLVLTPLMICQDCLPPATLSATPSLGFTNYQWYKNGLLLIGANSPTYQLCNFNASGNYYVTADDGQNNNCPVSSNTVQVVYLPEPVADIQGPTVSCVPANGPYTTTLYNLNNFSNYSYLWTAIPLGSVSFSPNNTNSTMASVTALGNYQIVLTVTDNNTGCMAMDTFCVVFCPTPSVSVSGPSGILCEGKPYTFTASATPPANYVFVWSNGATGPAMTTSQAGYYNVTATNPECGCSATSSGYYIRQSPSAILFPVGCDTLCDSESIIAPLAMGGTIYPPGYTVQWFLTGNPIPIFTNTGPNPTLNLANFLPTPLQYGLNNLYIVVSYQGCSDTSNVYNLFIKHCCVCKSDLTLSQNGIEYPVFCDPHVGFIPTLPCPADDVIVSGIIGFVYPVTNEPCDSTDVIWELAKPGGSTQGGITTNYTSFLFPKDSVDEPGLYCLTLTTISADGMDTCTCKVSWVRDSCDTCTCGHFTDMNWRPSQGAPNQPITCGNELTLGCLPVGYNVQFGGIFDCMGTNCPPSVVNWELREIGNNNLVTSGTTNGPGFQVSIPASNFVFPKSYKLTFTGICNGVVCEMCMFTIFTTECPCYCGTFSNMLFLMNRNVQVVQAFCNSPEVPVGCPEAGHSIYFTGLFQCAGPNCPPTAQVTWELFRLPNTTTPVASSSTTANSYFGISILPAWYAIPGSYELHLTGHCGLQECPCIIKFTVNCPTPCPCDVPALNAAVNQGFAITKYPTSCKACFSPIALSDCETVEWHLNTANGPLIGTSIGNQTICHTFPGSGTYIVVMVVTRLKPDGSLCEVFTHSQTVSLTCLIVTDCGDSSFPNPTFGLGANGGDLGSGGTSAGWSAYAGMPLVVEGEPGSFDAWTIQLSGNFDTSGVLNSSEPLCLEKDAGTVSLRFGIREKGIKAMMFVNLYRGDNFDLEECEGGSCYELACIQLDGLDADEWLELEIPYDLSNWMATDDCGDHAGLLVRPAVYVTNKLSIVQGTDINTIVSLDNFCFDGMLVATDDPKLTHGIRLFPNPTSGDLTLQFKGATPKAGQLQIQDLWGRVVHQETLTPGQQAHNFTLSNLPASVYFVNVLEGGEPIWVEKVVKQ